jgi:hypothetical protein
LAVSVVIRVGVGFGLASAAGLTGQVSGPLGAIAVGVAAPLLLEQMAKRLPVDVKTFGRADGTPDPLGQRRWGCGPEGPASST